MKFGGKDPSLVLKIIYSALLVLLFFVGFLLLGGTLYALVFLRDGEGAGTARPSGAGLSLAGGEQLFTGIGRIRVSAGDEGSPTIIVDITFPYSAADKPFSEELAARAGDFRTIAADYFKSFSAAGSGGPGSPKPTPKLTSDITSDVTPDLTPDFTLIDENILKQELLSRYNSILRLGKIRTLYFNDFLYLE
jgi:flagellar basal body-associated protein FliL